MLLFKCGVIDQSIFDDIFLVWFEWISLHKPTFIHVNSMLLCFLSQLCLKVKTFYFELKLVILIPLLCHSMPWHVCWVILGPRGKFGKAKVEGSMYKGRKHEENKGEVHIGVCMRTTHCAYAPEPQSHVCVRTTSCACTQEENQHVYVCTCPSTWLT